MTNVRHSTARIATESDLGRAIASRLDAGAQTLPHEISERLKSARMLALDKRRQAQALLATTVVATGGSAVLQLGAGFGESKWRFLGAWLPLFALVAGLVCIDYVQDTFRAQELADVDAELLIDDLPPAAFTDPGFAQFLNLNRAK